MIIRNALTASAVLLLVVAGADGRSPESDLAAPGAPLYEKAVTESVITLKSKKEQEALGAAGRPPSPGPDYFWCKNCKTYHKEKAPASQGQPAVAQSPGVAPAASPQPVSAAVRPPSPGADYYWCENCKTYHKRQTPASAQQPAAPHAHTAPPAVGSGIASPNWTSQTHMATPSALRISPSRPASSSARCCSINAFICSAQLPYNPQHPAPSLSFSDHQQLPAGPRWYDFGSFSACR